MAQMAGSNVIKGSFTPQIDGTGWQTINFGKTLNRYVVYVEMTDQGKANLLQEISGTTNNRAIGFLGTKWTAVDSSNDTAITYVERLNGSGVLSNGYISSYRFNNDNYQMEKATVSGGAGYVYIGYTYNYMIIPID